MRRPRNYRPKASEVSRPVFAEKRCRFAQAYPTIETLRVDITETGDLSYGASKNHYYTETTAGEYVDCSNPRCFAGGFSLGVHLGRMVWEKKTEMEVSEQCKGYEGSPKGRRRYGRCMNSFKGKITITYKI